MIKFILLSILSVLSVSLSSCQCATKNETHASLPHAGAIRVQQGAGEVGTYASSDSSFETASYWIEGTNGLVMIDTQFLFSTANESIDWAESLTGKKVVLAIVLHPNPDKFNGTEVFQKRGIRVITSEQVAQWIPSVHKDRYDSFYSRYEPDYPAIAAKPETFGSKTTVMTVAGIPLTLHVLGAGTSEAHVVVQYKSHVFVGDLIANLHHSWLEIGKTDEWLKRVSEIRAMKPEFVHPGRGPSGGAELLDREEEYLKFAIDTVGRAISRGPKTKSISDSALKSVVSKITQRYVGFGNEYFLEIGIPAEWDRQIKKNKK